MLEEAGRVPARPCTVGEAAAAEHSGEGAATQGGRRFREVSGVSLGMPEGLMGAANTFSLQAGRGTSGELWPLLSTERRCRSIRDNYRINYV
jgi:hypothetical protein